MKKENILFGFVGLLLGLIIGFFFANSINQQGPVAPSAAVQPSGDLPPGHPAVGGNNSDGAAIPEVQGAIDKAKQNPSDLDAQLKAAELYYQIQRFDGAIEFLKKANALQPDNYEVMVQLANVNFDADHYGEAEKWYTAALAKKADDPVVRTDLGLTFIYRDEPNYERAVQEFKRVLAAKPNHIPALQNLTVAYTKKAETANAKSTLAKLEELDPSNTGLTKLREDIQKLESK